MLSLAREIATTAPSWMNGLEIHRSYVLNSENGARPSRQGDADHGFQPGPR
jgi:hypothetical protein